MTDRFVVWPINDNYARNISSVGSADDGFPHPYFNFLVYELPHRFAYPVWLHASRILIGELECMIYMPTNLTHFCLVKSPILLISAVFNQFTSRSFKPGGFGQLWMEFAVYLLIKGMICYEWPL